MVAVAEGEDPLLGPGLLLIPAGSPESGIELVLTKPFQKGLGLHDIGMHLAAVSEGANTRFKPFLIVMNDQIPSLLSGMIIPEFDHLPELPF